MADEDIESILEVDEYALDQEWKNQPKLFFRYAKQLAEARKLLDEAEANVGVVRAKLDSMIRAEPEDFGLAKITEKAVEQAVEAHAKFRKVKEVVVDLKFRVNVLQAAVTALDHRKRSLENLVNLHGQHYFATPVTKMDKSVGEDIVKRSVRNSVTKTERE